MKLKRYYYPVILFMIAVAAWACTKGDDLPPDPVPTAGLNVINAVTDIKAIDFYLNGTRQNNNSAIYFLTASDYIDVPAGEQQYQFKNDDTVRTLLADIKLNLPKPDSTYTLLVTGQAGNHTLATIFLNDNFLTDTTNTAKVRLIQASPGTNAYDVFVGDTVSFKNKAFKSTTAFTNVGPGTKVIKVMLAGTTTPLVTDTVSLQPNSFYTVFTKGVRNGTGNNALGLGLNLR